MIQRKINQILKSLKCPHDQDPRRSLYFPLMCQSCARYARLHMENILQDWIYCNRDKDHCAASPHQHNTIMLNPHGFLQQIQNDFYGELLVQVKSDRVYLIAKFSNKPDDYINDVKILNKRNNSVKEIYFMHNKYADNKLRMDSVDLLRNNYHNAAGIIIGEIYFKFDISEVNVHLDIINDSHVKVIPNKNNNDTFTFIYRM